jgi:hypothetical protein
LLSVNSNALSWRYHVCMARLFILFLIALLPLRGWSTERMVMHSDHAEALTAQSHHAGETMSQDCAQHMQTESKASGQTATDTSDGQIHKTCEFCQLCMPLAYLAAPVVLTLTASPQVLPRMHSSRFVSADLAQGVKPPIS